jgi:micrococcal nuclease
LSGKFGLPANGARIGALFCLCLIPLHALGAPCGAQAITEWAQVRHVHDGDTVRLGDGRRVRLIGIDTPEVAYEERPGEPYGERARERLTELIKRSGNRVGLRYGTERRDDYGRELAHLYDRDRRNLSALLLSEGLAVILPVAPNLALRDCYARAEAQARGRARGLWGHPDYRERSSAELGRADVDRYRVVRGTVTRIGQSRSAVWVNLGDDVALRIPREDLVRFGNWDWDLLQGRELRARGQVYLRNGQLRISIQHPDNLELLD